MRNRIVALCGLIAVIGTGTAYGVMAQNGTGAPPTPPAAGKGRRTERHPELRRALRALNNAETALKAGSHDFSGHREKALDLTQQAIKEVQAAIASDKN